MFDDKQTLETWLTDCREFVEKAYGIDLLDLRDLHTGAYIGRLEESVFHTALIDEGLLDDSDDGKVLDIETLADALLVRSLASARPSPALNRPTPQTLRRLLDSRPAMVCAFLLNRYRLSDWRKLNHRDDSWFETMLSRIKIWDKLGEFEREGDAGEAPIRTLCHWLLELDSKCNLHDLTPVNGWFDKFLGLLDCEEFSLFVDEFAILVTPTIVEADKRMAIGNRMASSAYVKSWFDNPVQAQRKVEIAGRVKGKSRQELFERYGSVKTGILMEEWIAEGRLEKKKEKTKSDSRIIKGRSSRSKAAKLVNKHSGVLNDLFRSLTDAIEDGAAPSTPKPVRATGLPKRVG